MNEKESLIFSNPLLFFDHFYEDLPDYPHGPKYVSEKIFKTHPDYSESNDGYVNQDGLYLTNDEFYIDYVLSNYYNESLYNLRSRINESPELVQFYAGQLLDFAKTFNQISGYQYSAMRNISLNLIADISKRFGFRLNHSFIIMNYFLEEFWNLSNEVIKHNCKSLQELFKNNGSIVKPKHLFRSYNFGFHDYSPYSKDFDEFFDFLTAYVAIKVSDRINNYLACLNPDIISHFTSKLSEKFEYVNETLLYAKSKPAEILSNKISDLISDYKNIDSSEIVKLTEKKPTSNESEYGNSAQKEVSVKHSIVAYTLKNYKSKHQLITEMLNYLKDKGFVDRNTSFIDFKRLFKNTAPEHPVKWLTNKSDLTYLIRLLHIKHELIENIRQDIWKITDQLFVDKDGHKFGWETLRGLKEPSRSYVLSAAVNLIK